MRLYDTNAWKRIRREILDDEPLCSMCLEMGYYTPATVVDHVIPHKGDRELFFDLHNLQSVCKQCHDSAKAKEESRGVKHIGHDKDGMPLDTGHHWNTA